MGKRSANLNKILQEKLQIGLGDLVITGISAVAGFVLGCLGEWFVLNEFSRATLGTGIGGMLATILAATLYLNTKNYRLVEQRIAEQMKQMRIVRDRRAFDPQAVKRFITFIQAASAVYAVDRNEPDTWFLDENLLAYLAIQSHRITNRATQPFAVHRILIWPKTFYADNRYMQIVIMNWCLKVNTYLVPLDLIRDKEVSLIAYANASGIHQAAKDVVRTQAKMLITDEEFILRDANQSAAGIAKAYRNNVVSERDLNMDETAAHMIFFNWLLALTRDSAGNQPSKVNLSRIDFGNPFFLDKIEDEIEQIVANVCP